MSADIQGVIGVLHTDHAIAEWRAAGSLLDLFDGDEAQARQSVTDSIGRGISDDTATQLLDLIDRLVADRQRPGR